MQNGPVVTLSGCCGVGDTMPRTGQACNWQRLAAVRAPDQAANDVCATTGKSAQVPVSRLKQPF